VNDVSIVETESSDSAPSVVGFSRIAAAVRSSLIDNATGLQSGQSRVLQPWPGGHDQLARHTAWIKPLRRAGVLPASAHVRAVLR
jgi:hypothetical protein